MAKPKSGFFCQECGVQSPKWVGKCASCGSWNTVVEETLSSAPVKTWKEKGATKNTASRPTHIDEIVLDKEHRYVLPDAEFNRVLGGGLVAGSVVLLAGEPGIGKSTLLLQLALQVKGAHVLYVSGEESDQQIRMRASRVGNQGSGCFLFPETSLEVILSHVEEINPLFLIIDSIQTLSSDRAESSPGSVSQIRECTAELIRFAKDTGKAVFLIGHITKDGTIAGPKVLEHMVDTVLHFEGDRHHAYRILRTTKNRFGSASELGIYEMAGSGLREVENPSEILITQREEHLSGIAVSATLEGIRPLLIETQALVSSAVYGTPQRSTTGFDPRRLSMLLAVLEKKCGFRLGAKDVFLNIAGGIKVADPSLDLGVICSVLSSSEDLPVDRHACFAGEVGLSGEIRPVVRIEQRIAEAEKLGFTQFYLSRFNLKGLDTQRFKAITLHPVSKVEEVFSLLFG